MSDISNALALTLLKADLGYFGSALDPKVETYLSALLSTAEIRLTESGIVLDHDDVNDAQLQEMYAAWLYRKRAEGTAKPPMLQMAIRNRQVDNALIRTESEE